MTENKSKDKFTIAGVRVLGLLSNSLIVALIVAIPSYYLIPDIGFKKLLVILFVLFTIINIVA